MTSTLKRIFRAGALAAAMVLFPGWSTAAETVQVAAISGYAPTAAWVKVFEDYFVPEVDKALAAKGQYTVKWNRGFSGTVVKPRGELDAVSSGLGDIGIIVPPFHVDKLPLHNVSFVAPFAAGDLHVVNKAMQQIANDVPAFRKEWDALNLVYLGSAGSVNNYQAVCKTNKPTAADFKGVKVVGAGTNLLYFQGVGAIGINSNLGDFYNQLQTGVGACASVWAEAAAGFKLYEVAPFFIKIDQGAVTSFGLAANKAFWAKLPKPVAEAMQKAADGYGIALADYVNAASDKGLQTYREKGGTVVQYTPEQRRAWAAAMPNIAKEWAIATDKVGKPGTEVLKRYMDFLRANNQPIARQWDKE